MQQQSRPLQTVTDGSPIRLELIIRMIFVVLELRFPIRVEVFGDAPGMRLSELQRHSTTNAKGGPPQSMITSGIRSGQQSLDCVHVRIYAAVIRECGAVTVPGVDKHASIVIEEPLLPDV